MEYSDYEITIAYKRKRKFNERKHFRSSMDVVKCVKSLIEDSIDYAETLYALYLDNANRLIAVHRIGTGTVTYVNVDLKFILQGAILSNATQLVIVHNHPSGSVRPSLTDMNLVNKVKTACDLVDVKLVDNIIISNENYCSFCEEGRL